MKKLVLLLALVATGAMVAAEPKSKLQGFDYVANDPTENLLLGAFVDIASFVNDPVWTKSGYFKNTFYDAKNNLLNIKALEDLYYRVRMPIIYKKSGNSTQPCVIARVKMIFMGAVAHIATRLDQLRVITLGREKMFGENRIVYNDLTTSRFLKQASDFFDTQTRSMTVKVRK